MDINRLTPYQFLDCQPNSVQHLSAFRSSCPEQKIQYLEQKTMFPRSPHFLHADAVTAKLPSVRRSALHTATPVLPLHRRGAHIVGCYRHKCYCDPGQPTCGPTPPSFFGFCSRFFIFYHHCDIGSQFLGQVHALISDGWVPPSPPTLTPTLSFSLSGVCLPTRCPVFPLSRLNLIHSPLRRCPSFAFEMNSTALGQNENEALPPLFISPVQSALTSGPSMNRWFSCLDYWSSTGQGQGEVTT